MPSTPVPATGSRGVAARGEAAPGPAIGMGWRGDLVTAAFVAWLIVGLFVDGWAHNTRPLLETFFTPWHALFYSGFAAVAAWVGWSVSRRRSRSTGASWRAAVPPGYGPGGRPQHRGGVLQPCRERLLAEHVPAGGQRVQHQPGVPGRWGGDRHHLHPVVGEQPLRGDGVQAVGGGQRRGPAGVPVGDRHRLESRQLPGGVQDRRPEVPAPDQAEPDSRPRRAGHGQWRGSAWSSLTGSSRPVGVV